jgi:hypothetical protein
MAGRKRTLPGGSDGLCDYELALTPNTDDCYEMKRDVYTVLAKTGMDLDHRRFVYGIDPVTSAILVRSDDQRLAAVSRAVHPVPIPQVRKVYDFCLSASPMTNAFGEKWRTDDPAKWLTKRASAVGIDLLKCFCRNSETWCGLGGGRGGGFYLPSTVWVGQLRVEDTRCLSAVLRRGIGSHKAFGFGLLQLYTERRAA